MTLKFQLDSLEGVEESVAALYVEKDGKFVLDIDGLPQQEDVTGLKAKVTNEVTDKPAVGHQITAPDLITGEPATYRIVSPGIDPAKAHYEIQLRK
ncbi:hypothetical protein E5221_18185 [Pseudomonas sp. A2]|nr:hypothetical protein [Pseudomonas sp. A2]UPK86794.1 hypothetical protein E5221_18185 [Pseudomonas sp. A2]